VRSRDRLIAALVVCAIHAWAFVPGVDEWSSVLQNDFTPQAEAIESGELPYRDQEVEYPPLSIPVLQGPALFGDGADAYTRAFGWEMMIVDLAIVLLLALALPGTRRHVLSALGVYTAGVVLLSGAVLDPSLIDNGPLILNRFDLVPALLVLAAVLARDAGRSATWSALLAAGAGVKAFPLFLYPALLRGERRFARVAIGAAIPLLACIAIVVAWGDEFGAAITYHTNRELQIESLAATPFEIFHRLGWADASSGVGHGGFELVASGANVARWLSVALGVGAYVLLVWAGWRSRVSNLKLVTALLTVMVVFAPVLSPQFILWILPVSAAAYGLSRENALLLIAVLFTQIILQNYDQVDGLGGGFVWSIAARNLYLLLYLYFVFAPIVRAAREEAGEVPPAQVSPAVGPA
jgi:Glycosyltransferase family 87